MKDSTNVPSARYSSAFLPFLDSHPGGRLSDPLENGLFLFTSDWVHSESKQASGICKEFHIFLPSHFSTRWVRSSMHSEAGVIFKFTLKTDGFLQIQSSI